ncbi:MAG: type II restriction endonuclease [Candidatus Heimdallarchaeaceae archaeon]
MTKESNDEVKRTLKKLVDNCLNGDNIEHKQSTHYKELTNREREIIHKAKAQIPTLQDILELAIQKIEKESPNIIEVSYIKNHFSKCASILEQIAFKIYLKFEERMFITAINQWVTQNKETLEKLSKKFSKPSDFAREVCKRFYPIIQKMEFESAQKRKARGGKTFEYIVEYLLTRIGIECQRPEKKARKILKRVDLVVPNQNVAMTRPDQAYFLSCKRTLRERWKQTIPERKPSWRVFLLTLDDSLPEGKADEINALGMIVYLKDELKREDHLKDKGWVRKLSELPIDLGVKK